MPVYTKDEIGQLGSIINDITADFQEVLLMVGKINNSAVKSVDTVYNRVEVLQEKEITDDIRQELNMLYADIGELKSLVESFKFYQVDLTKVEGNARYGSYSALPLVRNGTLLVHVSLAVLTASVATGSGSAGLLSSFRS